MCLNSCSNQLSLYHCAEFCNNPKENPMVVTHEFGFLIFIQLLKYHGLKDRNEECCRDYMLILFIKEYDVAPRIERLAFCI
jgi:DNA polymerase-3 subunit delta